MIKDVCKEFPKENGFSVKLTLHKLEIGNPVRHPLPTDPSLFCFLDEHYCSLEDIIGRHKNSQVDGRNVYIIGSPNQGYRLALGTGSYVRGRRSEMMRIKIYRPFADIIFDER